MREYNGRDPKRIETFIQKLKEAWELYPDMRFGQLLATCTEKSNISGLEDDEVLAGIESYIQIMKCADR